MARTRTRPTFTPSLPAMESAVRAFLAAAGLDPARHPQLAQAPELVARAWSLEFLDGYRRQPREVLAERMSAPKGRRELVALTGLAFQSACPHHLLPYGGVAHIAYLPGAHVVGFGQVVQLLDCLSHRLILQEDLARQVADALFHELKARGAGVVLEAQQSCMTLRGGRRTGSKTVAEAFAGALSTDADLRQRFLCLARKG